MSLTNQNQQGSNKKGGKKAGTPNATKGTNAAKPPKGGQMKPKVNMVRKTGG